MCRTYRYYTGQPLIRFGEGLTYSKLAMKCTSNLIANTVTVVCLLTTDVGGDQILQVRARLRVCVLRHC